MQTNDAVDVVIVGSGMGGAAFAWQLAGKAKGLRIVCLERGGWIDRSQFPTADLGWQSAALGAWSASPNARLAAGGNADSADYEISDAGSPLKPLMWNAVGGSTVNWSAHFPRLHPSDFRVYTLDGTGVDWPIDYDTLAPWYELNDHMMGVAGLAGDPAYPPRPAPEFPPLALGSMGARAAKAFDALGWHHWPVNAAVLTRPRGQRKACNHCGPCSQGCVTGAKASTDIAYLPDAMARGVELRTRSVVTQIETAAGRATGVIYRDRTGREHRQPASVVVVAGNGVGTARLLLASGLGQSGDDDPLGGNLMMHPVAYVRGSFNDPLDGPVGPVGCCLYSHEFYETDRSRGFVRGLQLQITRENSLLLQALRNNPAWGPDAQMSISQEFRHSMAVMVMTEDLPEAHNRISVSRDIAADGLPGVAIDYRPSANTDAMLRFGMDRAEELLRSAGAYRVDRQPYPPMTGWHLLGTAAMGTDPEASVVDPHGRCHAVPNILVCDGSIFPTAGAVNPASTIGALALLFADRLAEEMK